MVHKAYERQNHLHQVTVVLLLLLLIIITIIPEALDPLAVSYTHLDVYKRQALAYTFEVSNIKKLIESISTL